MPEMTGYASRARGRMPAQPEAMVEPNTHPRQITSQDQIR
jgi:hypothetical protein